MLDRPGVSVRLFTHDLPHQPLDQVLSKDAVYRLSPGRLRWHISTLDASQRKPFRHFPDCLRDDPENETKQELFQCPSASI
jgi:hypothetical protein